MTTAQILEYRVAYLHAAHLFAVNPSHSAWQALVGAASNYQAVTTKAVEVFEFPLEIVEL